MDISTVCPQSLEKSRDEMSESTGIGLHSLAEYRRYGIIEPDCGTIHLLWSAYVEVVLPRSLQAKV